MQVLSDKQDITSRRRGVIIKQKQKIKLRVASLTKIVTFLFIFTQMFYFYFPATIKNKTDNIWMLTPFLCDRQRYTCTNPYFKVGVLIKIRFKINKTIIITVYKQFTS